MLLCQNRLLSFIIILMHAALIVGTKCHVYWHHHYHPCMYPTGWITFSENFFLSSLSSYSWYCYIFSHHHFLFSISYLAFSLCLVLVFPSGCLCSIFIFMVLKQVHFHITFTHVHNTTSLISTTFIVSAFSGLT